MNRSQKLVLGCFILIALLIGSFPPWRYDVGGSTQGVHKSIGFRLLFRHPSFPLTKTETSYVADETKPQTSSPYAAKEYKDRGCTGRDRKDDLVCEYLKYAMEPAPVQKAVATTTQIGSIEAHIDTTELVVEWVTLLLVSSALLLMLRPHTS